MRASIEQFAELLLLGRKFSAIKHTLSSTEVPLCLESV